MLCLLGQQRAAAEVVGDFGGDAQQHFGGLGGKPHVVFAVDVGVVLGVGGEAAGFVHFQCGDEGNAEVLEQSALQGRQIPDAVFVDEPVGLGVARLVLVAEAAFVLLFDGGLQQGKGAAVFAQVFMGHGLHLGGAARLGGVELFQQVAQAGVREQVFGACHARIAVQ